MDKELSDRIQSKLEMRYGRELFTVEEVVEVLEERKLTRRGEPHTPSVSDKDKEHLEKIRERDIQRRIAEEGGIIGGMRETFNIAFLLDYIDKLEGKN